MLHGTNIDQEGESENENVKKENMWVEDEKERLIRCGVGHNKGGYEWQEQILFYVC